MTGIEKDVQKEIADLRNEIRDLRDFVKVLYSMMIDEGEWDDDALGIRRLNT